MQELFLESFVMYDISSLYLSQKTSLHEYLSTGVGGIIVVMQGNGVMTYPHGSRTRIGGRAFHGRGQTDPRHGRRGDSSKKHQAV